MVAVPLTLSVTDVVVVEGPVKVNVKDPLVLGSEAELPAEIDTLGFEVPSLLFESLSFEQLIAKRDNAIKSNDTDVASAWSNLQSAKSLLESVKSQVEAAEIANEGITLEYESGLSGRSTLDVIQSSSILLNSEISLANFERNYLLAQYNLLKSIGLLTSSYLKLK